MMSHSATVLFALAMMANATDHEVATLYRDQLAAGQKFEIRTPERLYRGELTNAATGECQMDWSADGGTFSAPRKVYLLGATAGPQARQMLVLMREVKVGLKMELGVDDLEQKNRLITGEVKAIRLMD